MARVGKRGAPGLRRSRTSERKLPTERPLVTGLGDEDLLQRLELLDALARTHGHRVERVVGDVDRHAGLVLQALVESTEQRAATGEDDAAVHDISGQLRRS